MQKFLGERTMLQALINLFTGKKPEAQPEAPYKIEAPVVPEVAPVVEQKAKPAKITAAKKPAVKAKTAKKTKSKKNG